MFERSKTERSNWAMDYLITTAISLMVTNMKQKKMLLLVNLLIRQLHQVQNPNFRQMRVTVTILNMKIVVVRMKLWKLTQGFNSQTD